MKRSLSTPPPPAAGGLPSIFCLQICQFGVFRTNGIMQRGASVPGVFPLAPSSQGLSLGSTGGPHSFFTAE